DVMHRPGRPGPGGPPPRGPRAEPSPGRPQTGAPPRSVRELWLRQGDGDQRMRDKPGTRRITSGRAKGEVTASTQSTETGAAEPGRGDRPAPCRRRRGTDR